MKLSPTQQAYIAGFLDGDGSIYVRAKKNDTYRYNYQIAPTIVFFQSAKSEELFREFHRLLNLGMMRKRKDGILEITVNRIAELRQLIQLVKPFILLKRKQLVLLEKILDTKEKVENESEFKTLLKLIDSYRDLNYSKKRNTLTP